MVLFLGRTVQISHGMVLETPLLNLYTTARQVRCLQGHAIACPLYQQILELNPSDGTTATRLAASPNAMTRLERIAHTHDSIDSIRDYLQELNYTSESVGALLTENNEMRSCICPIYVIPAAAGTSRFKPRKLNQLQVLVSLFLLGLAVPISSVPNFLLNSGLVFPCDIDSSLAIAYVSIFPFDIPGDGKTLFFMTDWHPRVLSTTRINKEEEAVMYIGPDSVALAQHFILGFHRKGDCWLDLCTGSGIQSIVASQLGLCQHVVCVDVNPRALRFTRFNAALNNLEESRMSLIHGDLIANNGRLGIEEEVQPLTSLLKKISGTYQVVTVNPPFLPVPPSIDVMRHGLFSAGGPSGEAVLKAVLLLVDDVLEENGFMAVVSEFFFGSKPFDLMSFIGRGKSLLLTNQYPISAVEYAKRRADSKQEFDLWLSHLAEQGIDSISPGLLYIQKLTNVLSWKNVHVPKSSQGSVWTPSNPSAVRFTRETANQYFHNDIFIL